MESYKANKFLFVTSVLSILVLLLGTTFSYFTVSNRSEYDAVKVEANKIQLALSLNPVYTGNELIPTNDSDIMKAYDNECVDIYGRGACIAYELEITNFNSRQDMFGTIDFDVKKINNLSYIVLDENNEVYVEKQSISNGITEGMTLGEHFVLEDSTETNPTTRKFTIIIWLTNLEKEDQSDADANGSFTATVSFESVYGSKLTGTINASNINENNNTGVEDV